MRRLWAAVIVIGAVSWGGGAAAQLTGITVLGGGLGHDCSAAAIGGESGLAVDRICTQALATEMMLPGDRAATFVNRGVVRLRDRRYEEAMQDFSVALRLRPGMPEAYVNRGAAQIGARRYPEAVADLDISLSMGVIEPEKAYYNRGLAYAMLGNAKAAYADYRMAHELKPTWELARDQFLRFSFLHSELNEAPPPTPPER
jgi:tetratricopeptide (TPR) repeat protein